MQKHKLLKVTLLAYFIGNISAKNIKIHSCVSSYSKPQVGRFLRHGVDYDGMAQMQDWKVQEGKMTGLIGLEFDGLETAGLENDGPLERTLTR